MIIFLFGMKTMEVYTDYIGIIEIIQESRKDLMEIMGDFKKRIKEKINRI